MSDFISEFTKLYETLKVNEDFTVLEFLYKKDEKEFVKLVLLKLEGEANCKIINYGKIKVLVSFVQRWYPFSSGQESEFRRIALLLLRRLLIELNVNMSSHSLSYALIDIFYHNPSLLEGVSKETLHEICELLSGFASYKYDIIENGVGDLYLAVHLSVGVMGYIDQSISRRYLGCFKNHFDNRIREEYIESFDEN